MRFHIPGVFHNRTSKTLNPCCAFSQKILNLCKMLRMCGHEVYHYGNAGGEPDCTEHVDLLSEAEYQEHFSVIDMSLSWNQQHVDVDKGKRLFNDRAISAINARKRPGDFMLAAFGYNHKDITDAVDIPMTVESGVGYIGTFTKYRVFESYPLAAYNYGRESVTTGKVWGQPATDDAVIPNYYDLADFTYQPDKGDYFAFFGRLNLDKGVQIAIDTATVLGRRIVIAGQGDINKFRLNPLVEYIGVADFKTRDKIMGGASAVLVPTQYFEPFGGVNVEAQLTGTPAITTDWGGFSDTVAQGISGYRCRTLAEFIIAAKNVDKIKPIDCRKWAERYSLENIAPAYQGYFQRISMEAGIKVG